MNVKASDALKALVGLPSEATDYLRPTAVLFNGGVFNAAPIRKRVLDLLASWNEGAPVRELAGFQPDLAVAKGAALYGRNRATGKGIRIKAGTARSYYIGLETSMPAIPGFKPPIKALCIVPQGMEEGSELLIEGQEFGLMTGQPADFRFFASEVRSGDTPGQIIPNAERELEETSRIEVTLPAIEGFARGPADPCANQPSSHRAWQPRTLDEAHRLGSPLESRVPGANGIKAEISTADFADWTDKDFDRI